MEPEVHIVEKFMQMRKKCFTMTNIRLKSGKEIDLLAVNPRTLERFHIECKVSISRSFRLREKDTQTKNGRRLKLGLDTLNETKFSHPVVVESIKEIWGGSKYRKILVVGDVQNEEVIEKAKLVHGIEIWKISDLMINFIPFLGSRGYRDDVLRTIQLLLGKLEPYLTFEAII